MRPLLFSKLNVLNFLSLNLCLDSLCVTFIFMYLYVNMYDEDILLPRIVSLIFIKKYPNESNETKLLETYI